MLVSILGPLLTPLVVPGFIPLLGPLLALSLCVPGTAKLFIVSNKTMRIVRESVSLTALMSISAHDCIINLNIDPPLMRFRLHHAATTLKQKQKPTDSSEQTKQKQKPRITSLVPFHSYWVLRILAMLFESLS